MVFVIVVVERKDLEMEAHAMKKTFFTITGTKYYYGSKFFEPGMRVQLIKDKENQYDREAIQVNVKGLGKVGYVANSPYTVLGESMSAFSTKLDTLKAGTQSLADGSASLTSGLNTLKTGAGTLASGTATLSSGTQSLTDGLSQLDTGAGTLQSGMSELKSGSATLYSGTETLYNGVSELKSGTDTLSSNSSKLNDGAGELKDATDELIDKLNETEDGVNSFVENVNSIKAAARDYKSFGGAASDTTTSTKFIIKVGGVETANK